MLILLCHCMPETVSTAQQYGKGRKRERSATIVVQHTFCVPDHLVALHSHTHAPFTAYVHQMGSKTSPSRSCKCHPALLAMPAYVAMVKEMALTTQVYEAHMVHSSSGSGGPPFSGDQHPAKGMEELLVRCVGG